MKTRHLVITAVAALGSMIALASAGCGGSASTASIDTGDASTDGSSAGDASADTSNAPSCPAGPQAPLGDACTTGGLTCRYGYQPIECGGRTVICRDGTWQELEHSDPQPTCHGGIDGGASDASVFGPCSTTSDCAKSQVCAYKESDGCNAAGACVAVAPGVGSCAIPPQVCGCDGVTTSLGGGWCALPQGYASTPIAHTGACK